jgi:hypothetical protein
VEAEGVKDEIEAVGEILESLMNSFGLSLRFLGIFLRKGLQSKQKILPQQRQ